MAAPLITLTTDFGLSDPYVGVMKGVIHGINPEATVVDLTHGVQPQAVEQAAFLIAKSCRWFPPNTIHVVVVDPGVGTARHPLVVTTPAGVFVGPDNGALGGVCLSDKGGSLAPGCVAYCLTNREYWKFPVSDTFHGRDVFSPVAAHLSLGVAPARMGIKLDSLTPLHSPKPAWENGRIRGRVVHVDHFGNLVTDIEAGLLGEPRRVRVELMGESIPAISKSYAEGGDLLAIIGSFDTLEVAVRNASAQEWLGAEIGDVVQVVQV